MKDLAIKKIFSAGICTILIAGSLSVEAKDSTSLLPPATTHNPIPSNIVTVLGAGQSPLSYAKITDGTQTSTFDTKISTTPGCPAGTSPYAMTFIRQNAGPSAKTGRDDSVYSKTLRIICNRPTAISGTYQIKCIDARLYVADSYTTDNWVYIGWTLYCVPNSQIANWSTNS